MKLFLRLASSSSFSLTLSLRSYFSSSSFVLRFVRVARSREMSLSAGLAVAVVSFLRGSWWKASETSSVSGLISPRGAPSSLLLSF